MRRLLLVLSLLVCFTKSLGQAGFCFTPTTALVSGAGPRTLVSADFNSDGNLDIATANHNSNSVAVFFGLGSGAFSSATLYIVGTATSISNPRLTKGDFNNDGKPDLATSNEFGGSQEMSVLLNNGNGTFAAAVNYTAGNLPGFNMPQCLISNDFNNDNNADIALINMNGIALSIFLGNGTGSFPPCVNYSLAMMPLLVISDNFNNDAFDDLAISGSSVAILFGSASGTFSAASYYPNAGFFLTSGDLNGDGFKDIATSTGVLLGSGSGTFSPAGSYAIINGWGIACADYDGDGNKDLAVNTSTAITLLQGLGTGYFGSSANFILNTSPAEMISADFDNDTKPDLALGNGFSGMTANILLNRSFTIASIASPTAGCAGLTSNLSVSGGAMSYTWSTGSNSTSVIVTTTASSAYTVVGSNSLGCIATKTIPINIYPSPTLTISNSSTLMCSGATASTLQAVGATSYTWNSGFISPTLQINPLGSTIYSVSATSSLGCLGSQTISIQVNPLPVLTLTSDTLELCFGSTATVGVSGANTYTWSNGAAGNTVTLGPLSNTNLTVTGTSSLGCKSTNTLFVLVQALPVLTLSTSNATSCSGQTSSISAAGASSYSWSSGNTGSLIVVSPTVTTNYTVYGFNEEGCEGTGSITQHVTVCTNLLTKSAIFKENSFVFPNPGADIFYLRMHLVSMQTQIKVVNMLNQVILSKEVLGDVTEIDLSEFSDGVYFIHVSVDNTTSNVHKIIKQ